MTRSGTNGVRAVGYAALQHEQFNSNDFFYKKDGIEKPEARRVEAGLTIGGPLRRNRAFFFGEYQRTDAALCGWWQLTQHGRHTSGKLLQRRTFVLRRLIRALGPVHRLTSSGSRKRMRTPIVRNMWALPAAGSRYPAPYCHSRRQVVGCRSMRFGSFRMCS